MGAHVGYVLTRKHSGVPQCLHPKHDNQFVIPWILRVRTLFVLFAGEYNFVLRLTAGTAKNDDIIKQSLEP